MSSKKLILVTGASGFVGSQVVDHLLQAGYAVRGTSRSGKADELRKNCSHPAFEVAVVDDLIKGDLSVALKGVDGIIHVASPSAQGNDIIQVALEGTTNVLRQAHKAHVYKVTIISSIAATLTHVPELFDPKLVITHKDWNTTTKEEALRPGTEPFVVYAASKALSERAAWDFVDAHPEIQLTTILPPYIYGPIVRAQVVTDPSTMLSTNGWLYKLVCGEYPATVTPQGVDVRDVARATVLSLADHHASAGKKRRVLLWGGSFTWPQAVRHIAAARPGLKSRLVDGGEPKREPEADWARIETSTAKDILGLNEFIPWQRTVEDTIDSLLQREASDGWRK